MVAMIFAIALGMAIVPATEAPVGKWGIDYAQSKCIITRSFPLGNETAVLAIDADPMTGTGKLILLAPHFAKGKKFGWAKISSAPVGKGFSAQWSGQRDATGNPSISIWIDEKDWTNIIPARTVSIAGIDHDPIVVPTQGIDKAVRAAQACGRSLLQSWGADPDAMIEASTGKRPIEWLSYEDYPVDALLDRREGKVGILATINAKGKPTACRTVISSGVPSLDSVSCRMLMLRGSFGPSSRSNRYFYQTVIWAIPSS